jgi:hypothetical protein
MTTTKDRYAEMNAVLDECVAQVSASAIAYRKAQKRIGNDKTPMVASKLTEAQIKGMAREAMNARREGILSACVDSIAGEVAAG